MAAQDFRHPSQREGEPVADFIRRLEQLFKLAYGRDGMSDETRAALLHRQMQEGLRYDIMKAPAVSGSHSYKELCLASRDEEKRLAELAKRRQYLAPLQQSTSKETASDQMPKNQVDCRGKRHEGDESGGQRRCNQPGHLSWECPSRRTESSGTGTFPRQKPKQLVEDPSTDKGPPNTWPAGAIHLQQTCEETVVCNRVLDSHAISRNKFEDKLSVKGRVM